VLYLPLRAEPLLDPPDYLLLREVLLVQRGLRARLEYRHDGILFEHEPWGF
jgi:hypothetical protein